AAEEAEHGYEEDDVPGGRCAAILSNGRRCPNAALPGSRYCGIDSHQALANSDTDQLGDEAGLGVEEPPADVAVADGDDSAVA
ncbi:MAG: transcription termination/antitermination protein NusA, partial [Solirubrobacteraceae bacterium]